METRPGFSFTLRVFGGFELKAADGRDLTPSGKKLRALMACLALSPDTPWSRERLAALLWDDRDEEQARGSLRQALAELRRLLGETDPLLADRETISLKRSDVSVDALEFARLAQAGALEEATSFYRGDLLDGVGVPEGEFADWLLVERTRLHDLAVGVFVRLLETQAGETAIATAQRLLQLDPLREATHRKLMELYAARGDRARALRQYQVCRDSLRKELGIQPDPETEDLYSQVQRSSKSSPALLALRERLSRRAQDRAVSERDDANVARMIARTPRHWSWRSPAMVALAVGIAAIGATVWYAEVPDNPRNSESVVSSGPPKQFSAASPSDRSDGAARKASTPAGSDMLPSRVQGIPALVILPFQDLTGDQVQSQFGRAVAEELTAALSKFPWFDVVPISPTDLDIPAIKKKTGADFVIRGFLTSDKGTRAVAIELVRTETGSIEWSKEIPEPMMLSAELQRATAEKIRDTMGGLTGTLQKETERIALNKPAADLTEYDYFVLGDIYYRIHDRSSVLRAREIFNAGLDRYRDSVLMRCELSYTYRWMGQWYEPKEYEIQFQLVDEAASRPKKSRLDEWDYHYAAALAHFTRNNKRGLIAEAGATMDMAPYDHTTRADFAYLLAWAGSYDEAIESGQFAVIHDPNPPLWYFKNLVFAYKSAQRTEDGISFAQEQLRTTSPSILWHGFLGDLYAEAGRGPEARDSYKTYYKLGGLDVGYFDTAPTVAVTP